ncbi:trypsin-like serine protease [Enterococcus sp. ALS3]|uniref:Trypsin-like serine protease n=1 Tax=Enterococcus alishanensis TaxID=1303817 RepID=A0ABS6THY8_9ENTE|nr:trypsin-like serine protease [Enterococcus alishanensis]MBV7392485.1 trypsin-like serine protease [Enterococcus alishanensis]
MNKINKYRKIINCVAYVSIAANLFSFSQKTYAYDNTKKQEDSFSEDHYAESHKQPLLINSIETTSIEKIIGNDDRTKILNTQSPPYSSIVQIEMRFGTNDWYVGSGVLVSPNIVLTAGHVVYDNDTKKWASEIIVSPGRNEQIKPYGSTTSYALSAHDGWVNATSDSDLEEYDIGMIRLNEPLGIYSGWLNVSTNVTDNMQIITSGYPGDKYVNNIYPTMWTSSGYINELTENNLYYQLDTTGGQSGSPIYDTQNNVIGVHTSAFKDQTPLNVGTRITEDNYELIKNQVDNISSVYRLYNKNTGEHFYTTHPEEMYQLQNFGWSHEGISWLAPKSEIPIYRLYNPNAGDHHYTKSLQEREYLVTVGWEYEEIVFYSDSNETEPLYRLYNPNAISGTHHYTSDISEKSYLEKIGWKYEGISWYGL